MHWCWWTYRRGNLGTCKVKKQIVSDGNKKVRKWGNSKQLGHIQSKHKAPWSSCGSVQHAVNKCNASKLTVYFQPIKFSSSKKF